MHSRNNHIPLMQMIQINVRRIIVKSYYEAPKRSWEKVDYNIANKTLSDISLVFYTAGNYT